MLITVETVTLPDLGRAQCIALTTFRKTGQAVTTPVWFATAPGKIYVETHSDAGKLKRLRHTARVTFAPCTYSGKVTGPVSEGSARILTDPADCEAASIALTKKYGIMRSLYHVIRNARRRLQRKSKAGVVYIAIEAIEPPTG